MEYGVNIIKVIDLRWDIEEGVGLRSDIIIEKLSDFG